MVLRGTYRTRKAQAIRNAKRNGPVDWTAMQKRIRRMSRQGRTEYLDACHTKERR